MRESLHTPQLQSRTGKVRDFSSNINYCILIFKEKQIYFKFQCQIIRRQTYFYMFSSFVSQNVSSYLNYNHLMLCQIQQAQLQEPFIVLKNYRKTKFIQRKIATRKRLKEVPPITIKTRRMLATDVRQTSIFPQVSVELEVEERPSEEDIPQTPRQINTATAQRTDQQMKQMQYPALFNESLGFDIDNLLGFTGSKILQDVELLQQADKLVFDIPLNSLNINKRKQEKPQIIISAIKVSEFFVMESSSLYFQFFQACLQIIMNTNNQITTQNQLLQLFNSIKIDKSKEASVQKSTLLSLLIYHNVDTQYPEYFRYVSRSLQKVKKTTISQQQFLKIFMNPQIELAVADKNQLADAFSILDPNKTGSIDVNQFLEVYRQSQNYQKLPKEKRDQAEDQIKQAFFSASEDGKITPMDFYHIVKFR